MYEISKKVYLIVGNSFFLFYNYKKISLLVGKSEASSFTLRQKFPIEREKNNRLLLLKNYGHYLITNYSVLAIFRAKILSLILVEKY